MEALFPILVGAIVASVAYLVTSSRRQAQMEAWQHAARQLGLEHVTTTAARLFEGGSLEADSGLLHVRLESYRRGKYEHGTRILVTGFGHGCGGLWLRREGLASAFEKNLAGEREIELGDEAFDDPSSAVAALLEAGGRGQRGSCRQAIAEIQSRLPGAGAGQLSIAAGEAGALSLAEGDAGRLSIAEAEASPLPLAGEDASFSLAGDEAAPLSLAGDAAGQPSRAEDAPGSPAAPEPDRPVAAPRRRLRE